MSNNIISKNAEKLKKLLGRMATGALLLAIACLFPGCRSLQEDVQTVPFTSPLRYALLDVPVLPQETSNWCWAASAEMIMAYYGTPVPQHVQANNRFERSDCGLPNRSAQCIKGGRPEFERYGFLNPGTRFGALSWQELTRQIDSMRPVGFSWEWKPCRAIRSTCSHYMVARGYLLYECGDTGPGFTRLVAVNDPLPQASGERAGGSLLIMTYADYVRFDPRYTHSYSHFDITGQKRPSDRKFLSNITAEPPIQSALADAPRGTANPLTAAQYGLGLVKSLPPFLLLELGFPTPQTVHRCRLGEALYAYGLKPSLDQLSTAGDRPGDLILDSQEIHYPVMLDNTPITSVVIRKRGKIWAFALTGDKNAVAAARAIMKLPGGIGNKTEYFMVQLPSLNLSFLAYISRENQLYFILTNVLPDVHFPLHIPVPARDVLWILKTMHEDEEPGDQYITKKDEKKAIADALDWMSEILNRTGIFKKSSKEKEKMDEKDNEGH